jgi:hypothetical protein
MILRVISVIVASILPLLINLLILNRIMDKCYVIFEGKEVLIFIKIVFFAVNWTLSFLWLWFTIKVINSYKKITGNKMYLLLLLTPVAFGHIVFLTFFVIYYSIVPFAP